MEVKLPQSKSGTKIKTIQFAPNELSVNLKAKEKEVPLINTAEKLRSEFEEAISSLRMGPSTEDISTKIDFDVNLGECPLAINSFHSILQTLLKLMWETHKRKYTAVVQGFKCALEDKISNTQKILVQKRNLKESNEQLLKTFQIEAVKQAIVKFEDTWAVELGAARKKFQDESAGIETLVSKAMDFCGRIKVEPSQVDVGDLLEQTDAQLKHKTDCLWTVWNLHVERHKAVFQGNLPELQKIDKQIQDIDSSTERPNSSSFVPDLDSDLAQENKFDPTSETEIAYKAWMEFVKLLGILKIDYDIRITMAKKATTWMSSKITESLHTELSRACMEIIEKEQASILKNREKMRDILNDVKTSQTVIESEIKRACNNIHSQYSSALTQMQLTCDLSLEAARETLYQKSTALLSKKSHSL